MKVSRWKKVLGTIITNYPATLEPYPLPIIITRIRYVPVDQAIEFINLITDDKNIANNIKDLIIPLAQYGFDGEYAYAKVANNSIPYILLITSNTTVGTVSLKFLVCEETYPIESAKRTIQFSYGLSTILTI